MSRVAAVDLGTNTVRILVAEPDGRGFTQVFSDQVITRLGERLHVTGALAPEAMKRTANAVARLVLNAKIFEPFDLYIFATSAAREAENTETLESMIFSSTGVKMRVISWEEEARLALNGAKLVVGESVPKFILFDIGGGSTEYILSSDGACQSSTSANLGVVRLAETYLTKHPVVENEYDRMTAEINKTVDKAFTDIGAKGDEALVGTAGTITSLAALALNLTRYTPAKVNNFRLEATAVEQLRLKLSSMTIEERSRIIELDKGREDLIIPGIAVTLATLNQAGVKHLIVSDYGVREGFIMDIMDIKTNG